MAREILLYGHRGASIERPENTLASFARALELGASALESDVHMTRDGHVVCSHDPTGQRMAGVDRAILASSLVEVQSWDVGWGFLSGDGARPFAECGHHVPTLDETLAAFPETPLNLDVKQSSPSMVGPLLDVIRRHSAQPRVKLASFSAETLKAIRSAGYRGELALSRDELLAVFFGPLAALKRWDALRQPRRRAQIPTRAGPITLATRNFVDKCHALGVAVDFWTINDANAARELIDIGADGIMTDDVATIAPAIVPALSSGGPPARHASATPPPDARYDDAQPH